MEWTTATNKISLIKTSLSVSLDAMLVAHLSQLHLVWLQGGTFVAQLAVKQMSCTFSA